MERLNPGIIVETNTGARGVTVPDFMGCCADFETPVVLYGSEFFQGMQTDRLKVIGPENAVADALACGAGQREECCIFLTAGAGGFTCSRHDYERFQIQLRRQMMIAKREPTEAFPACQKFAGGK